MQLRHGLLACALAVTLTGPARATTVALAGDGQWSRFSVSDIDALSFGLEWIDNENTLSVGFGTPLEFTFQVAAGFRAALTVVDAGFAGDTFQVTNFGSLLGGTSAVATGDYASAADAGTDFDAALANASFSRAVFNFGPGSYRIAGHLDQSVSFEGLPLNSTVGAVSLSVSAVPEPASIVLLAGGGLALIGAAARRRRA
jgi:PEP-CTERM motif